MDRKNPCTANIRKRARLLRSKTTRNGNGAANHGGGVTGGAGYGVAAAAREISALRDTIKGAIDEAVSQALEDKLGDREAKGNEEHALAMRQLREDNAAHKKEIEDLSRAINELTKQIRELKNVQAADKENQQPNTSPLKRKKAELEWKPGLKFNENRDLAKKRQYNRLFKENDPEGWKKEQLERLERQRQALE